MADRPIVIGPFGKFRGRDRKTWETFVGEGVRSILSQLIKLPIGLPIAVGIAFGAKLQKKVFRVYCVVGDGEMQEGSMWEAIQVAVKYKLSNLTIIVDNNGLRNRDVDNESQSPNLVYQIPCPMQK